MKHTKAKVSTPVLVLIIVFGTLLCVLVNFFSAVNAYLVQSNSLSNYPNSHWKCEQLGVELFVNAKGKLSGTYTDGFDLIPLDVTNRNPSFNNHIECYAGDKLLYFDCFYENIDNGVFYVTISSSESTLCIDAIPDEVPYTFVKQTN